VDYQLRYINLSNPAAQQLPTPWNFTLPSSYTQYSPLSGTTNQTQLRFTVVSQDDDEGLGSGTPPTYLIAYFNVQAEILNDNVNSGKLRWTNLQSEYR
jgi:hypothetical protein